MNQFSAESITVWAWGVIALLNCVTAVLALHTNRNMATVEKATNSMKDALISATAKASFAAGQDAAKVVGDQNAAILAKGHAAGMADAAAAAAAAATTDLAVNDAVAPVKP